MAQGSLILPGAGEERSGTSGQTACGVEKPQGVGRSQTKGQYRNMGTLEGDGPWAGGCRQLCDALGGLIPSLCNDATRKLRERSPAKPGLTLPYCCPGRIFSAGCILLACIFSIRQEPRPRQALAMHPTSFEGKAASEPEGAV